MKTNGLRRLIVWSIFVLAANGLGAVTEGGAQLGLQSWTCRNMTFEEVVNFAVKHGISQVQFIPKHLGYRASKEEAVRRKEYLAARGVVGYTFGVVQPGLDKEANRKFFDFARLMDVRMIVVEPTDLAAWDNLEELVKEYDIRLAIHNHGRGTVYGDPATVKKILKDRDTRIGVCLDVGWLTAAGFDAAEVFREYGDRVFDLHFKDKRVEVVDEKAVPIDTEIGRGQTNFPGLFDEIAKRGWDGVLAIETDSKAFAEDPNRLVEEARTYFDAQMQRSFQQKR
jgi:sugar phosphate isomerase/epimerase